MTLEKVLDLHMEMIIVDGANSLKLLKVGRSGCSEGQ